MNSDQGGGGGGSGVYCGDLDWCVGGEGEVSYFLKRQGGRVGRALQPGRSNTELRIRQICTGR